MNNDSAAIRFQNVSKSFHDRTVLDNVSFEVRRGSAFAILGRSGTGKSVCLKHMIGLVKPDQGRVFVEGRDLTELNARRLSELRKKIGFLFQAAALFDSISLGENVAFSLRRHTDWPEEKIQKQVFEKLEKVGLERDYHKMPSTLSGGMRKRAGLARALAMNPSILLVDEPSSGLDPVTSEEIDELLLDLKEREKVTLVVVTHNILSARRIADEMTFLHEGALIARGTPEELQQSSNSLIQQFMGFQGAGN